MNEPFCVLELIYPAWLAWICFGLGDVILVLGLHRVATLIASGSYTFPGSLEFSNIFPVILLVFGIGISAAGIGGIAALNHPPFARKVADWLPVVLAEGDSPVTADFNDKPLEQISVGSSAAHYVVRLSTQARAFKVTGVYRDAPCDTELMNQICRNNGDKLTCDNDTANRVLRICTKIDEQQCRDRTL